MKQNNIQKRAFTLIELLMVIAIIGILAGILIPTVGAVRTKANIAASKSQLSNYVNAIKMFKSDYGYYPFVTGNDDVLEYKLSENSVEFIQTLSSRDPSSNQKATYGGNRRQISYHNFSEQEFLLEDDDSVSDTELADRFGNQEIILVIDGSGDGLVTVPDPQDPTGTQTKQLKADVTFYVKGGDSFPTYYLYE